ncbi:MAG: mechanosensitive ion channel domain-containing protein [Candidatus Omnitrophota bacterium]
MTKISKRIAWEIAKKVFLPIGLFFVFLAGWVFYKIRFAPLLTDQLQQNIKKYVLTALIICISIIIQRIIGAMIGWYKANVASKTPSRLDDDLIPIFTRVSTVVLWTVVLLTILPLYGVNINGLITALGVGSLAIALAAQDTIANIIAGSLIMIDRPFKIGDKIKIPSGELVKVIDIGVRRSKFLSDDNAIIIVPNLDLSKSKIVNYTYGEKT